MLTISQAAARFGLSRSTLLHYDRIGLVRPTYRTSADYRLYQEEDLGRLEWVCRYRKAGLPLTQIKDLLDCDNQDLPSIDKALKGRLSELNREIARLRRQQQVALSLLEDDTDRLGRSRILTKDAWIALLRETGLDDDEMSEWHRCFELRSPEAHQDFLESLGIPEAEIRAIRKAARGAKEKGTTTRGIPQPKEQERKTHGSFL